jgi:hypothetical protein
MLQMELIDPAHPGKSVLIDPARSPLSWFNSAGGNMPLDMPGAEDEEAREAIRAWVAAGARDDR